MKGDLFDTHFLPGLKAREGGARFTNRAADRGGPTRWGVTAATLGRWRRLGRDATAAEVEALGEAEADRLYRSAFYLEPGFDRIATISPRIAEELIDTGVNMGPGRPSKWLQRLLNAYNRRGRDYGDVTADGRIGPVTAVALRGLIAKRGQRLAEDLVLKGLNGLQLAEYLRITEAGGPNGDQEENIIGWIGQRVGLLA